MFALVSSAVVTNINSNSGYQIFYPQFTYVPINSSFELNTHVSNISNGLWINNSLINCKLHLYNSTGEHTFESGVLNKNVNWFDFDIFISKGNFTDAGEHAFYIFCYSADFGGEAKGTFIVNGAGEELTTGRAILNLGFIVLMLFLFVITLIGIGSLPDNEETDEYGKIIDITNTKYLKGVMVVIAWVLLMGTFFLASNVAMGYLFADMFGKILFVLFRIMFMGLLPFIVIWLIWLFVNIFKDKETRNMIERGVNMGDI